MLHGVALSSSAESKRAAGARLRDLGSAIPPLLGALAALSRTVGLSPSTAFVALFSIMTTGFHICLAIALALGLYGVC